MTRADFPPLLSQKQAARYLGVGVRTVAAMMRAGELPVKRVGSRAWVCRDAALKALEAVEPEAWATRALLRRKAG